MHVIGQDFAPAGGVAKALIKAGGDTIIQECKALGKPALYSTQYTKAGNLAVGQIAHVIAPSSIQIPDLKKCVDTFFDDVSKKNIARISFSAIGAGAMRFSESQSADLIFDNLCRIVKSKNPTLRLVRIVIFDKAKFIKFKDATKAYFASSGATTLSPRPGNPSPAPRKSFRSVSSSGSKIPKKLIKKDWVISITIYSDDRGKIDKAWEELKSHMNQNIQEMTVTDDVIQEFTDRDLEQLRELERDFDFKIEIDQQKGEVKFKGHVLDIASVQGKIGEIVNDIKDNKNKVPDYWVDSPPGGDKFHKFNLPTNSKEYQDIEAQFHKTAPNQIIVGIGGIQNREIYEVYNVKRQAMMKKHGSKFPGKELMLFHGTSAENIEKINAGGLNRSYAGQHATSFGRGVYFARDARYSCQQTYSPPDSQDLRYMYYSKVLVGEYTQGNSSMIVPPNKNSGNPNETFDSVVNNIAAPKIYVMFQDYEYYTEYLITFR